MAAVSRSRMGRSCLWAGRTPISRTIKRSRRSQMSYRFLFTILVLACAPAFGQALPKAKTPAKSYTPPKTPWGDPDLQGQWPAFANIPMQRPASFGTRAYLTDEEFAQRAKQAQ